MSEQMEIRHKRGAIRIALAPVNKAMDVVYVAVEVKSCWSATFSSWGRKASQPVIQIGDKIYVVSLTEVGAAAP